MYGRRAGLAIGASWAAARLRGNRRGAFLLRAEVQPRSAALDQSRYFCPLRRARQHVPLRLAAHERLRLAYVGNKTIPAIAFQDAGPP